MEIAVRESVKKITIGSHRFSPVNRLNREAQAVTEAAVIMYA